ncbi:hypothetical protein K2173_012729 [Erythroxylum novogranatense]|uniref:C2H2-type domain-containing protein n=1 Tax=Erythroxylum novogranatense TaxID=1862640 RepID=A0AAV8SS13_9ROSI|nr:hypothetical protein K2173_012729 [Erythroxylum novogranatense]
MRTLCVEDQKASIFVCSAPMERLKCKFCTRTFRNGRALGGHVRAHLATRPLPPNPLTEQHQLGDRTQSFSSSFSSASEEKELEIIKNREDEDKSLVYGLRENPRKSFKLADPDFSFILDVGSVVQDRESETESPKKPTGRRSKRTRKSDFGEIHNQNSGDNKLKWKERSCVVETERLSSVSDISLEEDVAVCLMMLSRDAWNRNSEEQDQRSVEMVEQSKEIIKVKRVRGKFSCEKCMKQFRSSQALGGHRRICALNEKEMRNGGKVDASSRIFQCPYCSLVFGSGQALGGHKRSHLMSSSRVASVSVSISDVAENVANLEDGLIDLNLPAPMEDDELTELSMVSDA